MAVRSKRLWGPVASGPAVATLYTCPAGETAIIKSLIVGAGGVPNNVVSFALRVGGVTTTLFEFTPSTTSSTAFNGLFWVLHPGNELRFSTVLGAVGSSGHGAELEGVAD